MISRNSDAVTERLLLLNRARCVAFDRRSRVNSTEATEAAATRADNNCQRYYGVSVINLEYM